MIDNVNAKLIVNGGTTLRGESFVSGSKNASLPIIAATLLANGRHKLSNVPLLSDVDGFATLLTTLGLSVSHAKNRVLTVTNNHDGSPTNCHAPYDIVSRMRASILVLGPLLASRGTAKVSLPGGCSIGARPVDLHLKALQLMGATISINHGYIEGSVEGRLHGANIDFDKVTVTGTANILMAATLANGTTTLRNAAMEPEIVDLCHALLNMGASISGIGTNTLVITGVESLSSGEYSIMPDRIEAGTLLCAVTATGGDVVVHNCPISTLNTVIHKLQAMGAEIYADNSHIGSIHVVSKKRLQAVDVDTNPYPGMPTDMQAQLMTLLAISDGTSVVTENIFENRFMHVPELNRMGAHIHANETTAFITGVETLYGAPVKATDLRASASLLIAGLCAQGTTEIHDIYHLDRGYEKFEDKLIALGAKITRQS